MSADTPTHCHACGAAIPADAPEGVCPKCILALAAETGSHPEPDQIGDWVGRYRILEQIGEGGFGVVYMAEQREPVRRKVALKVIKAGMDTREVIARFEAERQALAMMDHPNIAKILDAGSTENGRPYFVMDLVHGVPITEFCDQNRFDTHERLELFLDVCSAVQHAHQKAVIHRDLKPSNILVTMHDEKPVPQIIDFGVAKAIGQELTEKTIFTAFGRMVGTPQYMSPEQANMSGLDIDTRSDIYALGALLYELLTGTTPIRVEEMRHAAYEKVLRMIRETEPQKPSTRFTSLGETASEIARRRGEPPDKLGRLLRGDLDWIVLKALEKDRNRRYETANGFAADIRRHLNDEPVVASPPTTAYRLQKFVHRNRAPVAFACVIGFLLVIGTTVSTWQAYRAWQAQKESEDTAEEYRRLLYSADMQVGSEAAEQANIGNLRRLLDRHVPQAGQRDLRGFEWYYLWRLAHPPSRSVSFPENLVSLAASPDDQRVAVAGRSTIYLVEVDTMEVQERLDGHTAELMHVAFHPDGRRLLSVAGRGKHFGELILWDIAAQREEAREEFDSSVLGLAVSPDGLTALLQLRNHSAVLWSIDRWSADRIVPGPGGPAAAFSPDGRYFASGGWGRTTVWDREAKRTTMAKHSSGGLAWFLTEGRSFILADWDGTIKIVDFSSGEEETLPGAHKGPVAALATSANGQWFATASEDRTVAVWNARTLRKHNTIVAHDGDAADIAFVSGSQLLATIGRLDRTLCFSNFLDAPNTLIGFNSGVSAAALSPDGRVLATRTNRGTLKFWNVSTGRLLSSISGFSRFGMATFSPDGRWLADASSSGAVRLINWRTGSSVQLFRAVQSDDPHIAFSPDGRRLAVTSRKKPEVEIWDWASANQLRAMPIEHPATRVSYSPDGRSLLTADSVNDLETSVSTWELETGVRLTTWPMNWPKTTRGSAFSPDGRKIALYYEDGTIEILDVSKQELLKILKGHAKAVNDVVWWPDGKTLATGGYDNTVRIWRVETGEQVAAFNTHENIVSDLSLSDDGMTLASASLDRTVRLYRMASEEEVHEGASHWIPPLPVIRDETDMQEGLILKFSFEDEDFVERLGDTYLLDRSGLGNNALCGDNYRIGEGVVGKALYNNGEALALATYVLNGIGSYTIVAWIFLNDHGDSTFDGPPTLCKEIGGYQLDLVDGWIRALAYRKERKATRGAWIRDLSSEPMVATGQWVFVAAALDATTEASPLRVAVNHRSEILNSWPVQHRTVHGTATIAEGFHGRIDELMIFDRFLEEGELAELSGLGLEQHALPEVIKQESRPTYRSIGGPAPENGWDATASGAIRVRADDEKRQGGWNGAASNTVTGAGIDTFSGTGHSNDPYIKGFWWAENNPGANPRGGTVPGAHWIEYEFDHVYDLSKIWVWNFNERDHLGKNQRLFGIKDATIQVSRTGGSNPSDWTTVFAGEIAPSRGEPAMPPSLRLDLSDTQARYVVITAHNNHGDPGNIGEQKGIDGRTVVGLSEVRFFTTESLTADGE